MNTEPAAVPNLPEGYTVGEEDVEEEMDMDTEEGMQQAADGGDTMTAKELGLYQEQLEMMRSSRLNMGGKEVNKMQDDDEEMVDA